MRQTSIHLTQGALVAVELVVLGQMFLEQLLVVAHLLKVQFQSL
jgi:hypothetical protein